MGYTVRHTGIVVRDLDSSRRFYEQVLGFRLLRDMDESGDYINNMLALPDVRVMTVKLEAPGGGIVELLKFLKPDALSSKPRESNEYGITHMAFTVDDLDAEYQRLRAEGIEFNAPPQKSPDGYAKVTFCRDPEGNLLELVQVVGG